MFRIVERTYPGEGDYYVVQRRIQYMGLPGRFWEDVTERHLATTVTKRWQANEGGLACARRFMNECKRAAQGDRVVEEA